MQKQQQTFTRAHTHTQKQTQAFIIINISCTLLMSVLLNYVCVCNVNKRTPLKYSNKIISISFNPFFIFINSHAMVFFLFYFIKAHIIVKGKKEI